LTWNDLMFIRMERAIERQQQRLREQTAEVDWLNRQMTDAEDGNEV